ncbi:MAG: hypothetical protein VX642_02180 [Bdellovibrionota bacterium]|nr:hypothetical protein [Bdellovibrionota bacterium]
MKGVLALILSVFVLCACELDVSGGGGGGGGTPPGNLDVEVLKISTNANYVANLVEVDGSQAEVKKIFTIDSTTSMELAGGGASYFEMGCSTAPTYLLELVRFNEEGVEVSRAEINYDSFSIAEGENAQVEVSIKEIAGDCMSVNYSFYINYVE